MNKLKSSLITAVTVIMLFALMQGSAFAVEEQHGYIQPENVIDFIPRDADTGSGSFHILQSGSVVTGYYSGIQFESSESPYCIGDDRAYNTDHSQFITPVKDQGELGDCWIFGTMGALETSIWKQFGVELDISEMYTVYASSNTSYINNPYNVYINKDEEFYAEYGGSEVMMAAYWSRGTLGDLVPEEKLEYTCEYVYDANVGFQVPTPYTKKLSEIQELSDYALDYYPSQTIFLNNNSQHSGNNYSALTAAAYIRETKDLIKEFGSVAAGIFYSKSYNKEYNGSRVYKLNSFDSGSQSYDCNHEVLLVGWDDDFDCGSTNPGAFLVKNSYGTMDYGKGYFWMSYDSYFTDVMAVAKVVKASELYDRIYETDSTVFETQYVQYDYDAVHTGFYDPGEYALMKRTYSASSGSEILTGIMVYSTEPDTEYKVYFTDSDTVTSGTAWTELKTAPDIALSVDSKTGYTKSANTGYLTIRFAEPPTVSGNFTLYVVAHNESSFTISATDPGDPMCGSAVSSSIWYSASEITPDNFDSASRLDSYTTINYTLKAFTKQKCGAVSHVEIPYLFGTGATFSERTAKFNIGSWTESVPVYTSYNEGSTDRYISSSISNSKLCLTLSTDLRESVTGYSQRCYLGFRDENGNEIRVPVTIGKRANAKTDTVLIDGILYVNAASSGNQYILAQYDGTSGKMLTDTNIYKTDLSPVFDLRSIICSGNKFKLFSLDSSCAPVRSAFDSGPG